ncbi:MAG: ATP-binding protein [bacterium]
MQIEVTLLFITAVVNSLLSLFVLLGKRNKVNYVYSFFVLFASFWSIGLGLFITETDFVRALGIANFYYFAAAGIPLFFLYFSLLFPDRNTNIKKIYLFLLSLPLVALTILLFVDNHLLLKEVFPTNWGKDVTINKLNYIVYTFYFVIYTLYAFYNLIKSYITTDKPEEQKQLKFVILGTTVGFIFGMIFDLFLPLIGNYKYIYIGPLFSFSMVATIAYSITRHHLFDVKVVATESLTFILWVAILVRTLIADTLNDKLVNVGFLVVSIILGIFLIKSVIREVEQREKIEKLAKDLERVNFDLATANDRLKELDQLKSEFLSLATHQIRSPLTAIKGYASLILEGDYGNVPENVRGAVKTIFDSCQNLVLIVGDFLDISRIEQGRMKYDISDFDLKKLVEEVVNEYKPNIERAGLSIHFKFNAKENYTIHADPGKIKQVVGNLIDNSIKYTPHGEIRVRLSEFGKKIHFAISDTGIGIAKNDIPKLFSKFSRAKDASKTNVVGTGLGLYVARQMIIAMDGKIWVESEGLGQGSTFYVELPKGQTN